MTRPRIKETDQGIQGEFNVRMYDEMQRILRDRGWIETKDLISSGIAKGQALELGPGPGYLGLEWLKNTQGTRLTALDISADMIRVAEANARTYGLEDRVTYVKGSGNAIPFEDKRFDAVFTNGSLHEWEHPVETLDEIWRVLKPGGRVYISDLRRDMFAPLRWLMWLSTRPRSIRPGLLTSIFAAYTPDELRDLIGSTRLAGSNVSSNWIGVTVAGAK